MYRQRERAFFECSLSLEFAKVKWLGGPTKSAEIYEQFLSDGRVGPWTRDPLKNVKLKMDDAEEYW